MYQLTSSFLERKLLLITFFIISALYQNTCQAQVLDLKPKLLSFRNSRITIGILAHYNGNTQLNEDADFQYFTGKFPDPSLKTVYSTTSVPYFSTGIYFDLLAPNSLMSIALGGEYNYQAFSITSSNWQFRFDYQVRNIIVPAYLKFQFGSIHAKTNALLCTGAFYSFPINYTFGFNGREEILTNQQQSGWGLSGIFGFQYRFIKEKTKGNITEVAYPRSWLFIRADVLTKSLFNPNAPQQVIPGFDNSLLDYKVYNLSAGLTFFFGNSRK